MKLNSSKIWTQVTVSSSYCCILTSDLAKHAIAITAEVAYSVGQLWEEIAWASSTDNMGQG